MPDDFYSAVETAKKIEKNALEHTNFSDKIEVVRSLDFEPREFEDYLPRSSSYVSNNKKIMSAAKILGGVSTGNQS